jgi:hypothetical protein
VYRSPNRVETGASGTASARVRYTSDTRWGAKIVITADERAWENTGSYVDIVGFDITNTYGQGRHGLINYGTHVRMLGNHAHHISQQSCDPVGGGAGLDDGNFTGGSNAFLDNVVDHIGPTDGSQCGAHVQGIYESSPNGLIANNIVDNVSGYGIYCWHGATAEKVVNNLSFQNGISGIIVAAGGAPTIAIDDSLIANNIVVYNADRGISEYGDAGPNNRFINNDMFGNSGGPISLVNSHNTVSGTLNVDPQFVNYRPDGSGDYHLRATSPLIGTGMRLSSLITDADGNARPQKQGYDIGPYVYVAGRVSPTPTTGSAPADIATSTPATSAGYYTPPDGQGLYEECRVSDRATCANELKQMAAGGFTVVLNYDSNLGSASDLLAFADAADALGMKVIWALSDPIFWTGDALGKYSQLAATCGCSSNIGLARYIVSVVKNHPATWGYYVGDELTSSVHSQWLTYSDAISAADSSHPRLIIQLNEAQGAVSPYTAQFADGAEVIGQDYYPIGQTVYGLYTNTGNMAAAVQAVVDQMHRDDAIVLQAFAWSEYSGGTLVFPTQAEMRTMLTQALASSRPRLVLWYSYFDIMRSDDPTQHWNDLISAAKLAAQPSTRAATHR